MSRKITVEINQQQEELVQRLIAEGFAATQAEAIHKGFIQFCKEHPEILTVVTEVEARV